MTEKQRKIVHIDMDSFFPSVEILDSPHLKNKPVAVGGMPERRGVIASCNYIARKYGVHSAMASHRALMLCPHLTIIRTNMDKYVKYSKVIREIFAQYTDKIEPLSLDEAYLDVTDSKFHQNSATLIAKEIKKTIFDTTRLTSSAGVAPNKFLAKVASDWNKPNGLMVITPKIIDKFILELPIQKIPGVGKVTAQKMKNMGINLCKDLQDLTKFELIQHFKNYGLTLYELARGIDEREVITERIRKSLSVENTFSEDLKTLESCLKQIEALFEDFSRRIKKADNLKIAKLFVKLKDNQFKQVTFESSHYKKPSIEHFNILLKNCYTKLPTPIRLIGIGVRFEDLNSENTQLLLDL